MSETGLQSGHGRLLERQVNAILRGVVLDAVAGPELGHAGHR
jgi:hypothetical protein